MRFTLVALTVVLVPPLAAQGNDPLAFLRRRPETVDLTFSEYRDQPYTPVRTGEVQSATFLTDGMTMPFGAVLGPVVPPQIHATELGELAFAGAVIAVRPPAGAKYQRGDTVLLADIVPGPKGWGDIVIPTGLARIGDSSPRQTLATVLANYGSIHSGEVTLPLMPFTNPGRVAPVAISGPSAEVIAGSETRELEQVGSNLFVTLGKGSGIKIGDFVEVRRRPGPQPDNADAIDDLMAVAQVIHVGEKSATIRLTRVLDGDIRPGTPVVRIATLPG
ncbi:MAG TPA: hypothetical protein VGL65_11010 [Gemmatimonadales bacterium]|jgi:hypothetical protein